MQSIRRVPTEEGVIEYTEGLCWLLALKMKRLYPAGMLVDVMNAHVVLKVGDDVYLDVLGLHTGDQLLDDWQWTGDLDLGLVEGWKPADWGIERRIYVKQTHAAARRMAKLLIDKFLAGELTIPT